MRLMGGLLFFFFQAEDGIRDVAVTGVQTCALPICLSTSSSWAETAAGTTSRTIPPGRGSLFPGLPESWLWILRKVPLSRKFPTPQAYTALLWFTTWARALPATAGKTL